MWPPQGQLMHLALGITCARADSAPSVSTGVYVPLAGVQRSLLCFWSGICSVLGGIGSRDLIQYMPGLCLCEPGPEVVCRHLVLRPGAPESSSATWSCAQNEPIKISLAFLVLWLVVHNSNLYGFRFLPRDSTPSLCTLCEAPACQAGHAC